MPSHPTSRKGDWNVEPDPVRGSGVVLYSVRSGDTLSGIGARFGVSVGDLLRWNGLTFDSVLYPGDQVRIYRQGGS